MTKPARSTNRRPARPWPVTANAWLLLFETLGFLALGALYLGPLGAQWPFTPELWEAKRIAFFTGLVFALFALLSLSAALGFFRLVPAAWVNAVTVQGAALMLALVLYFRGRPAYVYGIMLYGIFMVLYLHQADVQAAFRPPPPGPTEAPQTDPP
jgi:hypothetical protein